MRISTSGFSLQVLAVSIALLVSQAAPAAQEEGRREVEFAGGFSHAAGSDVGTVNADVSLGYYLAPRLDVGVRQTLSYSFVDNGDDTWTASTIPFIEYSFETSNEKFRPFIGAFAGAAYNADDVTGTAGPSAGFKYYLSDDTAVVARYRYEWYFNELSFNDVTDTADGNHIVTVGLSYNW